LTHGTNKNSPLDREAARNQSPELDRKQCCCLHGSLQSLRVTAAHGLDGVEQVLWKPQRNGVGRGFQIGQDDTPGFRPVDIIGVMGFRAFIGLGGKAGTRVLIDNAPSCGCSYRCAIGLQPDRRFV
jgi:hypothetical protein